MADDLKFLQGIDTLAFFRNLADAKTKEAAVMPWQTSLSFDPQRNIDTNATKDGMVPTTSSLETDFEIEFTNNTSALADMMYDSLFDGETLEAWVVYKGRQNAQGQYFAWYFRAVVSEDSNDNDPDDNSNRDVTFTVSGTPKRGWVTLTDEQQEAVDYVFQGLGVVTDEDKTGQGAAWKAADAGTNAAPAPVSK